VRSPRQLPLPFPGPEPAPLPAGADSRDRDAVAAAWRERARAATADHLERARGRWPDARIPEPKVTFDLRGLSAGEAYPRPPAIRYNAELLLQHGQAFLDEIVPHEVAHLVVAAVFPGRRRPHGREWKIVMELFGAPARRCHSWEVEPARRVKRFAYRCACSTPHLLTKRAHLRIRRGTAEYSCRRCGSVLVRTEG
jgi:SprT protein